MRRQIKPVFSIVFALLLLGGSAPAVYAQGQPAADWPQIEVVEVTDGLTAPVHVTHAGDGSGRLFVVEQPGRIRIIQGGQVLPTPFLDIRARVRSPQSGGGPEEGLLSVAFPPQYAQRGHFYVYYTNPQGDNVVSRFGLTADPNVADAASEVEILYLHHPTYGNHNGGQMAFGPEGSLYIATGDGGGGGDPQGNAQNPASLLGKLLRIEVEARVVDPQHSLYLPLVAGGGAGEEGGRLYSIPEDNPFVGQDGYRPEIWALGLRNPWRFSFDRQTGDLYIGDVGQGSWEEINFQAAASGGGENYGWNLMEGPVCYQGQCDPAGLTPPVIAYATHEGGTCAVTGGMVYRGAAFPALQGIYLFGDYCGGQIWGLQPVGEGWENHSFLDTAHRISSFGEDEAGEVYLSDLNGAVYRVEVSAP